MLPSVTVVEEVREVILKSPTVEDVHVYPLQKIFYSNNMAIVLYTHQTQDSWSLTS